MRGINLQRWLIGGVAAGVVIWILEGIAGMFYMEDMQASLDAIGISMDMSTEVFVLSILVSLLVGLVSIYFYAAQPHTVRRGTADRGSGRGHAVSRRLSAQPDRLPHVWPVPGSPARVVVPDRADRNDRRDVSRRVDLPRRSGRRKRVPRQVFA